MFRGTSTNLIPTAVLHFNVLNVGKWREVENFTVSILRHCFGLLVFHFRNAGFHDSHISLINFKILYVLHIKFLKISIWAVLKQPIFLKKMF